MSIKILNKLCNCNGISFPIIMIANSIMQLDKEKANSNVFFYIVVSNSYLIRHSVSKKSYICKQFIFKVYHFNW